MPEESSTSKSTRPPASTPQNRQAPLTYNSYLKVSELKRLQVCQSEPAHHDELLFVIIHQAYELWFKLILHELDTVLELLSAGSVRRANFFLRRVVAVMRLLVDQIHILETMSPRDFMGFRYNLNPASGFQSSQFREIEFALGLKDPRLLSHFQADAEAYERLKERFQAPSLGDAFFELLRRQGFDIPPAQPRTMSEPEWESLQSLFKQQGSGGPPCEHASAPEEAPAELQEQRIQALLKVYNDPETHAGLHDLAESMFDIDELVYLWRTHHVTVVERMIGFKRGTGGSEGVGYLRATMMKRCFPELWKLRTYLEQ